MRPFGRGGGRGVRQEFDSALEVGPTGRYAVEHPRDGAFVLVRERRVLGFGQFVKYVARALELEKSARSQEPGISGGGASQPARSEDGHDRVEVAADVSLAGGGERCGKDGGVALSARRSVWHPIDVYRLNAPASFPPAVTRDRLR
jgi:hypothetical protein